MRNNSARRRSLTQTYPCQHLSRRAEALDGLVFMMAAVLLVGWILGHLLLAFFPDLVNSTAAADGAAAGHGDLAAAGDSDSNSDSSSLSGGDFASGDRGGSSDRGGSGARGGSGTNGLAEADAKKYEAAAAELRSEIDALKTKNKNLLADNSSLKLAEPSLPTVDEQELAKLRDDLRLANEQLGMANKNASAASQRVQNRESAFKELQNRFGDLQSQLELAKSDLASSKASLKMEPLLPELPTEDQNAANEALQEEVKQAEAEVSSLQRQVVSLEQELKSANNEMKAREQEFASLNMRTMQPAEAEELKNKVANLNRDLERAMNKMSAREQEFASTSNTLQQLQATNRDLKNQLAAAATRPAASPATGSGLAVTMKPEDFRDFTSSKGSVSKMAFIRWEGDDGIIVRSFADKRLYRLTLDRFSDADKKYLLDRK